jgi:hypothetical protein
MGVCFGVAGARRIAEVHDHGARSLTLAFLADVPDG